MSVESDLTFPFMQSSLSTRELVLRLPEALVVLEALAAAKVPVLGWEGWIRYPDGKVGHSREYQGTVSIDRNPGEALSDYVQRSVSFARQTIIDSRDAWDRELRFRAGNSISASLPLMPNKRMQLAGASGLMNVG